VLRNGLRRRCWRNYISIRKSIQEFPVGLIVFSPAMRYWMQTYTPWNRTFLVTSKLRMKIPKKTYLSFRSTELQGLVTITCKTLLYIIIAMKLLDYNGPFLRLMGFAARPSIMPFLIPMMSGAKCFWLVSNTKIK